MEESESVGSQVLEAGTNPQKVKIERSVWGLDDLAAWVYFHAGKLSYKSVTRLEGEGGVIRGVIRSPETRLQRAAAYHLWIEEREQREIDRALGRSSEIPEQSKIDWEYFKKLDRFDSQYHETKRIEVESTETGKQSITYSEVFLGEDEADVKETVYIIPAYSGTRYGYESLARALALKGYRVRSFDYPDSPLGEPEEVFTQKVKESNDPKKPVNYDPHTSLFKNAIRQLAESDEEGDREDDDETKDKKKLTIYSYSTGCPILAEALSDPEFSKIVTSAVLLSPASAVDQSLMSLFLGFRKERKGLLLSAESENKLTRSYHRIRSKVNTGVVLGARGQGRQEKEARKSDVLDKITSKEEKKKRKEFKKRRNVIKGILMAKVCRKSDAFKTARVGDEEDSANAKIIVQTGGLDEATKSEEIIEELLENNPQIVSLHCPNLAHIGPLYVAEELVDEIDRITEDSSGDRRLTFSVKK